MSFLFTPMLLKSGSYTIEVRADNQAGSGRTVQFALESTGDALFTDTNVGANVAITYSTTNNPCNTY
ncbi:MAG: hypothetical protein ORO03_08615 [Alphaproteobacteria bacterium]|nr:hypothetical protein [Alphaproteobacteria bacterium]